MKSAAIIVLSLLWVAGAAGSTVFVEDFEEDSIGTVTDRWDGVKNTDMLSLSDLVRPGSPGTQSLLMRHVADQNTGAHLYKMLAEGYDSLFARFYVRFAPTHDPIHHFVWMGGYNPPTPWPQGHAGIRPDGDDRFTSGIETRKSLWTWDFYTYWMHMVGSEEAGYWGNKFNPDPPAPVPLDEWICVEMMIRCNDPVTSFNGEQAFWINGTKVHHLGEGFPNGYWSGNSFYPDPAGDPFEGFQWRSVEELRINFFWLSYYMTGGEAGKIDSVWFDDVVVATERIGPATGAPLAPPSAPGFRLRATPNPFNPETVIRFQLAEPGHADLAVYDLRGRMVERIGCGWFSGGDQTIRWRAVDEGGASLPSGVYFVRLDGDRRSATTRVVLVR